MKLRFPRLPAKLQRNKDSIATVTVLYLAWKNLTTKKLRTFLTIFGIIIGIGAIFFLLSFGLGLQHIVTEEVIGNQSIKSIDITSPNSKILALNQETFDRIGKLPHVDRMGRSFSYPGSLSYSGSETDTIVYGVDPVYQELSNLTVIKGRQIASEDSRVAYLNTALLQSLGIENVESVLDQQIRLLVPLAAGAEPIAEDLTVIGIIDTGSGGEIFVPNHLFESAGQTSYKQFKLIADDTNNITDLRKQIESLGFLTTSPVDTIDQINQIFRFFNIILVSFGAIGMIVAVLGMFNTLTISLLERTREIGLMIALGGRQFDMKRLFIIEAVMLSVAGAVIGMILATINGEVINIIMNRLARSRGVLETFDLFATPYWLVMGILAFMVMVGLAVAFFPARRAQRINPIDALRRE
ncbi:MAG: ABC transporter permease [Candidatus Saccharibacteria bacterium]|nr:ABC transporter permease [Candidatus Saccharibacteria bacterium]